MRVLLRRLPRDRLRREPEFLLFKRCVECKHKAVTNGHSFVFDLTIDGEWLQQDGYHINQLSSIVDHALDKVVSALFTAFDFIPNLERRRHIILRFEGFENGGGVFEAPHTIVIDPFSHVSTTDLEKTIFHELVHYFLQDLQIVPGRAFFNYLFEGLPKAFERLVYGFDKAHLLGLPFNLECESNVPYNAGGYMVWNLLTTNERRNLSRVISNDPGAHMHVEFALKEQSVDSERFLRSFIFPHIDFTICLKPHIGNCQFIGCSYNPESMPEPYIILLSPWDRQNIRILGVDEYVLRAIPPALKHTFGPAPSELFPTLADAYKMHKPFMLKFRAMN